MRGAVVLSIVAALSLACCSTAPSGMDAGGGVNCGVACNRLVSGPLVACPRGGSDLNPEFMNTCGSICSASAGNGTASLFVCASGASDCATFVRCYDTFDAGGGG